MFKNILIPTDGSPTSAKAVRAGVALAKEMGARVVGYHAQEPVPAHAFGYVADQRLIEDLEQRSTRFAHKCVDEIAEEAKNAGVDFEPLVVRTPAPYKGIVDAAKDRGCDAIVMSSHGYRALARLVLGSVTQQVLSHSEIPVLVYR